MTRYALLCDSAPNDYRQKKFEDMFDSLSEKDAWHVNCMANDTDEFILEYVLNNVIDGDASEETIWFGGNEIRKDMIEYCARLFAENEIDFQVMYDSDREIVSEEELGYEELSGTERQDFIAKVNAGAIRIGR